MTRWCQRCISFQDTMHLNDTYGCLVAMLNIVIHYNNQHELLLLVIMSCVIVRYGAETVPLSVYPKTSRHKSHHQEIPDKSYF